jgi:glutaminase
MLCMDTSSVLAAVAREVDPHLGSGQVAQYIPALARVPASHFGMAVHSVDGAAAGIGDAALPFSIQSISKVFSLTLALQAKGPAVWDFVGREPSGNPFNSLIQLEREEGRPRNPFINAGAIRIADLLCSVYADPKRALQDLGQRVCGEAFRFDAEVADSERATGFRNRALANFMKSFGKLDNDVDQVLDLYFHQCAIALSCSQLAQAMGYLANAGVAPTTAQAILTPRQARRVNALMLTCGTYDAAGEFAFRIGLPCKSGVGGGIVAIVPGRMALCVWSPGLDETGNSAAGRRALESFVAHTGHSVF